MVVLKITWNCQSLIYQNWFLIGGFCKAISKVSRNMLDCSISWLMYLERDFFSVFPFSQNSYIKNSIESKEVPKGKSFLAFLRPNFGINLRFRIFFSCWKKSHFSRLVGYLSISKKLDKSWSIIFHIFSILYLHTKINFT